MVFPLRVRVRLCRCMAALLALLMCLVPISIDADQLNISGGLNVDGLISTHAINGQKQPVDVPLPMFTVDARYRGFDVGAEWLPGIPISLGSGNQLTELSILIASANVHLGPYFKVGVGSTLLNQVSRFVPVTSTAGGALFSDQTTESSRVVGARFTFGYINEHTGATVMVGVAPKMHGGVHDQCVENSPILGVSPCYQSGLTAFGQDVSESAAEVDVSLRVWRPLGHHLEWMYGWRYLNFVGNIPYATHGDTDQNIGTGPSVGLRWQP